MIIKPRSLSLIPFIIVALLLPSLSSAQTQSPLAIAEEAYSHGDYQKAQEQFALAFRSGTSLEAGIGLADTLLKLDRWKEARDAALKAMRLRSTSPEATALYGDALFREGNLNDAGLQYLRALSLDQQNTRALVGLAVMKLSRSENEGAIGYLRDAIAAKPDTARAYYWLGVVFQNLGRYSEAAEAYDKFLSFKATGYPESTLAGGLSLMVASLRRFGESTPYVLERASPLVYPLDFSLHAPIMIVVNGGKLRKFLIDTTVQDFVYLVQDKYDLKTTLELTLDPELVQDKDRNSFLIRLRNLQLGVTNTTVRNAPACIISQSALEQILNRKLPDVDGVIGLGWLRSYVAAFDYKNPSLKISSPPLADSLQRLIAPSVIGTPPNVLIKLPFQIIHGKIIVTGSIGDDPVSWLLSTGETGMTVSSDYATEHFKPDQMTKNGQTDVVKNLVLNFGGLDISNPNVEISKKLDETISKETGLQFAGVLGQQFLRNLSKLTIDFPNMTIAFEIQGKK